MAWLCLVFDNRQDQLMDVWRPGSKREGTLSITGLERMGSVRRIRACTNSTRLSVSQLDFE
jgi:hypothetical protein